VGLEIVLVATGAFLASALATGVVRRLAMAHGVIDVPNQRSSHAVPTPRGGGLAVAVVSIAALLILAGSGRLSWSLAVALAGGGGAVAIVGFLDDRRALPVGIRLAVHVAAAVWALVYLGGLPPIQLGERVLSLGWFGDALAVLSVVWVLNLFNFMDGIDGIAASEAVFIALASLLLSVLGGATGDVPSATAVFAAACGGFLVWNWPPAKIFLGDVGSGFLGYIVAVLAIAATRSNPGSIWVWLILGGVFFVDATLTLLRRALRGEHMHHAHRSHAYQWLARNWASHRRVTVAVALVNVAWLLPFALFASLRGDLGLYVAAGGITPLIGLALMCGSGRAEGTSARR